jgi:Pyruvate/2-oxoacid:ferredoxin oxidoreductase delta subunit
MSFTLLLAIVVVLGFALLLAAARRAELRTMEHSVKERDRVLRHGSPDAQLQHPVVDLSRCLGCGKCVEVCPEKGVLELVHGQAVVVNGARCVGIAECERESGRRDHRDHRQPRAAHRHPGADRGARVGDDPRPLPGR